MQSCLLHTLNHTPHTHRALLKKETWLLIAAVSRLLMPLCSHTTVQRHSSRCRQTKQRGGSRQGAARIWCHTIGEEVCGVEGKEGGRGERAWGREEKMMEGTHCNTLRHTAVTCNTLQNTANTAIIATHCDALCDTLPHTATYCNRMQRTVTHRNTLQHAITHCNTLQRTATLYSTRQHTCNTLQHSLQHATRHHNKLQQTATHSNTMQHTAVLCKLYN